jgi:REP element-mobilizing transposase RayT
MRRARWIAPWKDSETKPAIYHCISRVVDRRFAFGVEEKERFRTLMRMMENFTGCRVLSYCLMCNHIHILVEVPPMPVGGVSDDVFLKRLSAIYGKSFVADVAGQLEAARCEGGLEGGNPERVEEIKGRFTYRMHDLGEFMKGLLQRFTQWFNGRHKRTGTLWEQRFKSVIVESGTAARTMAAYIDLNPVRAGIVEDPAEYRWSSYGEAVGGGAKGNGKKARIGLILAIQDPEARDRIDVAAWKDASRRYRRLLGMALERKPANSKSQTSRKSTVADSMNEAEALAAAGHGEATEDRHYLPELNMVKMLRCRIRYFTDGAVIGSKEFVNEAFGSARDRFSDKRKDGARRMRGSAAAAKELWSIRALRVGIG